ncbi:MAG: hypothetical protein GY851_15275, partial [bacterium]|nr:hypothetical protein [bacterium]
YTPPCNPTVNSLTCTEHLNLTSGTLTLNGNSTIQQFTQTGGTLAGTGDITVTDLYTWSGGEYVGAGTGTVTAQGGLAMSGYTWKTLESGTFVNGPNSIATLEGAGVFGLSLGDYAEFRNEGTFTAKAGGHSVSGTGTFKNQSGFILSADWDDIFTIYTRFGNSGTVDVQQGTLKLVGGVPTGVDAYTGDFTGADTLELAGSLSTDRNFGGAVTDVLV